MEGRLASLWRSRRAELRFTLRVTLATLVTYVLYAAFHLPQGYWAVFTVIIVMQGSIGGTVGVAVDRMVGTVAGALVGGLAAAVRPPGPEALGAALAVAVALTSLLAAVRPNMKVAPVTAAIMLLSATGGLSPEAAALFRVIEIALGSVVAVAVTVAVFPARSRAAVIEKVGKVVELLCARLEELASALDEGRPCPEVGATDPLREALAALEAAMLDAERQRTAFLGDHGVPQAVLRGLWRLRSDGIYVGRALVEPLHDAGRARLAASAAADLRGEAALLRACAEALACGRPVPAEAAAQRHAAFLTAFDALRAAGDTRGLTFADAGRVFGLAFALESLHRNATDLARRVDETASGRAAPARPTPPERERREEGAYLAAASSSRASPS